MTTPNAPDNNDDIIKVVYQAVADYSQLLRETRRAREETKALKADLDGLAGSTTHRVKVTADAAQAKTELAAVLRDVVVKVKVTVDAVAANAELQRLLRDVVVKAKVSVDAAGARADIARTVQNAVVKAKIVVDAAAARAEIARVTRDATVRVKVVADSTVAGLDRLLRNRAVRIGVALDQAGVTAQFRALLAHLESLGPVDIEVNVKQGTIDNLEAAARRLELIRDQVQSGGGGPPSPPAPKPAGGGGSSSSSSAGDKIDKIPGALTGAAGTVLLIGPLLAAALPVAAALVAAVGTVAATLAAAGAGAALFAVAAVGAFSKVTEAVQAYEKSGQIATGPLGEVVSKFEALKSQYNALVKATEPDVFGVFNRGLQIASDLLGKVQPLVSTVAKGIDSALDQVDAAVKGPGLTDFLSFVEQQAPHAISGLTSGLLDFGGGLGKLLLQFGPFVRQFVDGFAEIGRRFDAWASQLGTDTKFQQFLSYARDEIPRVVDLVVHLVQAAVNLGVALAPIGDVVLDVANALAEWIAEAPPHTLTEIAVAVLAVATAIKVAQAAIAINSGWEKFTGLLDKIKTKAGGAKKAVDDLAEAESKTGGAKSSGGLGDFLGSTVGKLGVFAAAFMVLNGPLDDMTKAQKIAAASARDHEDALKNLADQIVKTRAAGSPVPSADLGVRQATYDTLNKTVVATEQLDASSKRNNVSFRNGGGNSDVDPKTVTTAMNLNQVAQYSGVDLYTLNSGAGGDQAAYQKALQQFDAYIAARKEKLKELLKDPNATPAQVSQLAADVKLATDGRDAYAKLGGAQGEVTKQTKIQTDEQARLNAALGTGATKTDDATASTDANTTAVKSAVDAAEDLNGKLATQADLHKALKTALGADFSSGPAEQAYSAAAQALDAYDQQVQAAKAAQTQLTDANTAATRAQEDLTAARVAAVQRIRDLQRALRDMAVDERQAKLTAKESDENLAKLYANGASADEIEQAKIDNERAHNALNDLEQDKGDKKKTATDELAKGVAGNRAYQDAQKAVRDATVNLANAHTNLSNATTKLIDLHLAFQTAAGALGLSEGQVRKLKGAVDSLKSKTVNINVALNTKNADAAMAKLLQGQYGMQLMQQGMPYDKAMAEAAKHVPSLAPAAPKAPAGVAWPSISPANRAEGGPTPSPVTAGPVRGPGTGTSDSVLARLPVGGPARLSDGEHIVTDAEVKAAPGGHNYLEAFRAGLRAGRPWAPPAPRYAGGGRAAPPPVWSAALPTFRVPVGTPPVVPGYAGGGAVATAARTVTHLDRSLTVNVGTINNPVAEPAGTSLYKQVRKAIEGDEGGR